MLFSINETMGQYSELFMLLAAGTYTVAFIAFAWDLAKSSKMLRAVDLKAAELAAQAMTTEAVPSVRRRPSPVAAPRQVRDRPPTAACATPASGAPPPGWPSR
jgi:hypothetical protein